MDTFELLSGGKIPGLGLGTWELRGNQCEFVVKRAIEMGYVHIDTAWMYANQRDIGRAIREIGASREQLFITSKIWHTHMQYNDVLQQCDETLEQLQMDYVDLLLMHSPSQTVPLGETLAAFKQIFDVGKARSIGVSNFELEQVNEACRVSPVPISVNQVEYNVHCDRGELLAGCNVLGVHLTAHRPLAKGEIGSERILKEIGRTYGKSVAQIAMRWLLQKGLSAVPKSCSEVHLKENLDLFEWEMTVAEMTQISSLCK